MKWRARRRGKVLAALPLPIPELKARVDMLEIQVPRQRCDHTSDEAGLAGKSRPLRLQSTLQHQGKDR